MKTEDFISLYKNAARDVLSETREKAMDSFTSLGFPTKKNEEWKYTDLSKLLKQEFTLAATPDAGPFTRADFEELYPCAKGNYSIVFINGVYAPSVSTHKHAPSGLVIQSFFEEELQSESCKKSFSTIAPLNTDAFTSLNTALTKDGACISIPEKLVLDKPLCIFYIHTGKNGNKLIQPRNIIRACKDSYASILEIHSSAGEDSCFTNSVSEILVEENANLSLYKIEHQNKNSFQIDNTHVRQEKNSRFTAFTITRGGELVRNKLSILVAGENCETNMNGLYMGTGKGHIDNHTVVDHSVPNCQSNELYKGVMKDSSTGVFSGKIIVRKDAQKTNAFQSNKNILLSDEASVNSKPQLEIFADDVKCSHGATTGQIDPEALFYLKARGIGDDKARELLTFAFANEILERIPIAELREFLENEVVFHEEK